MKTKLFFGALIFLMLTGSSKAQEYQSPLSVLKPESAGLLDSIHQYLWSKSTSDWTDFIFTYITRDTLGNMTKSFEKIYYLNTWQNYIQELFTYINPAHPIFSSQTSQLWNSLTNDWETFAYTHANAQGRTDEQYNKQWNENTHKFISGYRDTTEFSQNLLSATIHQVFDTVSKGWDNSTMTSYTYDALNRNSETLIRNWNESASDWVNSMKMVNSWDTNNYFVLAETFVWDNIGMTWMNYHRTSYLDYFGGQPLHIVSENWNLETGQWYYIDKHTIAYMSNGSQSQDLFQNFDTVAQDWINAYLTNWTFYLSTLIQHERNGQFWNPNLGQWITNAYDENDSLRRNIESFYKYYSTLTYTIQGGSRNLTTYDTSGNRGSYLMQYLNINNNNWINNTRTTYTYDDKKNLTELLDQTYDTTATTWINSSKTVYYYFKVSGISEHKPSQRLCFYENPIHTGSIIDCPNLKTGNHYEIYIYDLSGKTVFARSFGGGEKVTFDKNLPEGLYIMRLNENGQPAYTGKIVVTR